MHSELDLLNLLWVLLAAWLAGNLAERFRYPSVLGELLVGIVLGPPLLGILHTTPALTVLAELGVLLMMLYIGMEIDVRGLGKASWAGLLAAVGGFITPFVMAYFTVVWFGGTALAGVFVGIAAGITSLATKSRILVDLKLLDTRVAHVLMAGALISDTMALLAFAAVMGVVEIGAFDLGRVGLVALRAFAFFAVAVAIGYRVFPWVGRRMTEAGLTNRTFHFTFVLLVAVTFGYLAELAGLHSILGAFIAGLFIHDNVLGRSLAQDLTRAVRDASLGFLAPIFFVTAGFAVSFRVFTGAELGLFLALVAVAVIGKVAGTVLFYLPTRFGWREGLTVGLGMNGRGAVEIIVAGIGLERGLITPEVFSILVFMAIFTTATVPVFLKWSTDWLRRRGELVRSREERRGTLIVGAGDIARMLGRMLAAGRPVRMLDSNPERCRAAERDGLRAHGGNALQEQDLSAAGAAEVDSLVAITTNPVVNALVARIAREVFDIPDIYLVQVTEEDQRRDGTLRHLEALSLFGGPLARDEWEHRVAVGEFVQDQMEISERTTGAALRQELLESGPTLPLVVWHQGNAVPFHSRTQLGIGDRVVLLRPATRLQGDESFQQLVVDCPILDVEGPLSPNDFFTAVATELMSSDEDRALLLRDFKSQGASGATILGPGLAIPHVTTGLPAAKPMLVVRVRNGISFPDQPEPVRAAFVLLRSALTPERYLHTLSNVARVAGGPSFLERWMAAAGVDALRALLGEPVRDVFGSKG